MKTIAYWLALAALLVTACATAGGAEPLPQRVDHFNRGVRWKRFDVAATCMDPAVRGAFLRAARAVQEDLQVEGAEVVEVHVGPEGETARVDVLLHYILYPSLVLTHDTIRQHWRRQGGEWVLERIENGPLACSGGEAENEKGQP